MPKICKRNSPKQARKWNSNKPHKQINPPVQISRGIFARLYAIKILQTAHIYSIVVIYSQLICVIDTINDYSCVNQILPPFGRNGVLTMIDPDGSLLLYIILLFVLLVLHALFVAGETALVTLNESKLRRMAAAGNKKAAAIERRIAHPARFLHSARIGAALCGFFAAAISAAVFVPCLAELLPFTRDIQLLVAFFAVTLVFTLIYITVGELVPKRIVMHYNERAELLAVGPLFFVISVCEPLSKLFFAVAGAILRIIGIGSNQIPEVVTEEEIRMMIDAGGESGNIEQQDKVMLNNIFEFGERVAADIMTHRTELTAIDASAEFAEVIEIATQSGYSRIPVYEDNLDDIVGILYAKDLLRIIATGTEDFSLKQCMREPLFALESESCKSLLEKIRERKIQMVVLVDEYGGTAGIATVEDLIESIVGNIQDEYDDEEEQIIQISENLYLVAGTAPLEDAALEIGLELDDFQFDTIGAYLVDKIGHIPGESEHPRITVGNITLTALEMDDRRVKRIEARIKGK